MSEKKVERGFVVITVAKRYSESEFAPEKRESDPTKKAPVLGRLKRGDLKGFSEKERGLLRAIDELIKEGAV